MRNRAIKFVLLVVAAVGGVVTWQRRNETPPVAPDARPSDPFMDPARPMAPPLAAPGTLPPGAGRTAAPGSSVDADVEGGPASDAGVVVQGREQEATGAADDAVAGGPAADAGHVGAAREAAEGAGRFTTPPPGDPDDLTQISGVGPKLEALLNEQGITTYAQLAELDVDGVDALQAHLPGFPGRIRRDDWVGQARRLLAD